MTNYLYLTLRKYNYETINTTPDFFTYYSLKPSFRHDSSRNPVSLIFYYLEKPGFPIEAFGNDEKVSLYVNSPWLNALFRINCFPVLRTVDAGQEEI
jgi:hypothetical protein